MVCHVILRRTRDWETASPDSLDAPFLVRAALAWERCFRTSYGACRARIKAIALDNLRALPGLIAETGQPDGFDRASVRDDDIVLVCDDDDFFHPRLLDHMQAVRAAGAWDRPVVWPDGKHGFHLPRDGGPMVLLPRVLERPVVDEAYRGPYCAIPGRMLHHAPDILEAFWTHSGLVEHFRREGPAFTKLAEPLSLIAKHPCSVSVLRSALAGGAVDDADIEGVLRSLVEQYVSSRPELQPAFAWARDYLAQFKRVFQAA